jgi:hypothetical protein
LPDLKLQVTHRYETGVKQVVIDNQNSCVVHLGGNGTAACTLIAPPPARDSAAAPLTPALFDEEMHTIGIIGPRESEASTFTHSFRIDKWIIDIFMRSQLTKIRRLTK